MNKKTYVLGFLGTNSQLLSLQGRLDAAISNAWGWVHRFLKKGLFLN
jgi:hypothetical protein